MIKIDIRQILCPTDFSTPSARAFEHALVLAEWYRAPVTVLHVLPEPVVAAPALAYGFTPALVDGSLRDAVQADLASLVGPANRAGLHAVTDLRDGNPATQTVRVAQEIGADLIVMGVHGRNALDLRVFGSTTNHVVRQATCPVLTLRN